MLMEFPCSSSIRLPNNDDDNDDCDYDDDDYDDYDYDDYDAPPSTTIIINASWSSIPISDILWYHIHLQSRPTWCWRHPPSRQQGGTSSQERWAAWVLPLSSSDGHPGPSAENLQCNYCHPIIVNCDACHQHRQSQSWLVAMDDNLPGPYHPQDPNPGLSP